MPFQICLRGILEVPLMCPRGDAKEAVDFMSLRIVLGSYSICCTQGRPL